MAILNNQSTASDAPSSQWLAAKGHAYEKRRIAARVGNDLERSGVRASDPSPNNEDWHKGKSIVEEGRHAYNSAIAIYTTLYSMSLNSEIRREYRDGSASSNFVHHAMDQRYETAEGMVKARHNDTFRGTTENEHLVKRFLKEQKNAGVDLKTLDPKATMIKGMNPDVSAVYINAIKNRATNGGNLAAYSICYQVYKDQKSLKSIENVNLRNNAGRFSAQQTLEKEINFNINGVNKAALRRDAGFSAWTQSLQLKHYERKWKRAKKTGKEFTHHTKIIGLSRKQSKAVFEQMGKDYSPSKLMLARNRLAAGTNAKRAAKGSRGQSVRGISRSLIDKTGITKEGDFGSGYQTISKWAAPAKTVAKFAWSTSKQVVRFGVSNKLTTKLYQHTLKQNWLRNNTLGGKAKDIPVDVLKQIKSRTLNGDIAKVKNAVQNTAVKAAKAPVRAVGYGVKLGASKVGGYVGRKLSGTAVGRAGAKVARFGKALTVKVKNGLSTKFAQTVGKAVNGLFGAVKKILGAPLKVIQALGAIGQAFGIVIFAYVGILAIMLFGNSMLVGLQQWASKVWNGEPTVGKTLVEVEAMELVYDTRVNAEVLAGTAANAAGNALDVMASWFGIETNIGADEIIIQTKEDRDSYDYYAVGLDTPITHSIAFQPIGLNLGTKVEDNAREIISIIAPLYTENDGLKAFFSDAQIQGIGPASVPAKSRLAVRTALILAIYANTHTFKGEQSTITTANEKSVVTMEYWTKKELGRKITTDGYRQYKRLTYTLTIKRGNEFFDAAAPIVLQVWRMAKGLTAAENSFLSKIEGVEKGLAKTILLYWFNNSEFADALKLETEEEFLAELRAWYDASMYKPDEVWTDEFTHGYHTTYIAILSDITTALQEVSTVVNVAPETIQYTIDWTKAPENVVKLSDDTFCYKGDVTILQITSKGKAKAIGTLSEDDPHYADVVGTGTLEVETNEKLYGRALTNDATFVNGSTIKATAIAKPLGQFVKWEVWKNGKLIKTYAYTTIEIPNAQGDYVLKAIFEPKETTIVKPGKTIDKGNSIVMLP